MSWLKERDEMKKELNETKRTRDDSEKEVKTLQRSLNEMVRLLFLYKSMQNVHVFSYKF